VAGEEQAIARRRAPVAGERPEPVQAVDLAVPEGILGLGVGAGDDEAEVLLREDRRAEDLVAGGDAGAREGHDVVAQHREHALDEARVGVCPRGLGVCVRPSAPQGRERAPRGGVCAGRAAVKG